MKDSIFWKIGVGLAVIKVILLVMVVMAFAGNVVDDNNNHNGDILIGTGDNNWGGQSEGHWTSPNVWIEQYKSILKGDTGEQGLPGLNGINGIDGKDGLDFDPAEVIRLDNRIDTETNDRIIGDNYLQGNINTEILYREKADKKLNNKINNEAIYRKQTDKKLQKNINVVDKNSKQRDIALQNNINNEAIVRTNTDTQLQKNIDNTNSRIDDVSNRVSTLEKTQYNVKTQVNFIREKNYEMGVYSIYNSNRNIVSEIGIAITLGTGKSWTETQIEKQNKRLDNLENKLGISPVIERTIENGKIKSIRIMDNGLAVDNKF
jgi:hypothetical protein